MGILSRKQIPKSQLGNDCVAKRCTMEADGLEMMVQEQHSLSATSRSKQLALHVWSQVKWKEAGRS